MKNPFKLEAKILLLIPIAVVLIGLIAALIIDFFGRHNPHG
jgi:hypothetical protein